MQAAFEPVLAVVARTGNRRDAQRVLALVEERATAVVFKADERVARKLGFDRDVAGQASVAADGVGCDDAQAIDLVITHVVGAAEELVATADGEHDAVVLDVGAELVSPRTQLMGDGELVAVGAAADQDDVGGCEVELIAHANVVDFGGDAAPCAAPLDDHGIAAIAIQVQGVWVEVDDAKRSVEDGGCGKLITCGNRCLLAVRGLVDLGRRDARIFRTQAFEIGYNRRERRVVGDSEENIPGGLVGDGFECLFDVFHNRGVDAGVFEADLQVVGTRAAHKGANCRSFGETLEVDVPNPGDIATVGFGIVQEKGHETTVRGFDLLNLAVEADRVLGEIARHRAAHGPPARHAPARGDVGIEHVLEARGVGAQGAGSGAGGHDVVHHVQAVVGGGKGELAGVFCRVAR